MYLQQHYIGEKYPVFCCSLQCTQQHDDGSHPKYIQISWLSLSCNRLQVDFVVCVFFFGFALRNAIEIESKSAGVSACYLDASKNVCFGVCFGCFICIFAVNCLLYHLYVALQSVRLPLWTRRIGSRQNDESTSEAQKRESKKRTTMRRVEKELQLVSCVHLEMAEEGW